MGPVLAAPVALERAGLTLADDRLGRDARGVRRAGALQPRVGSSRASGRRAPDSAEPVGEVDRSRLNVMGGSISIGHPFGATGGRILTTLANELVRRDGQFGLMTVCAAGGMGHAMVIERA